MRGEIDGKPTPTAEHQRLEQLSGKWIGEERIKGSPHASASDATGTLEFRSILDGLFMTMDYVETAGGKTLPRGHGVIGWDAKQKRYTLHWFDTFGSPPGGTWNGSVGERHAHVPSRGQREHHPSARDFGLIFKIEMDVDGTGMKPIIEGKYRRAGPSAVSEADQPEPDRVTSRS